MNTIHLPTQNDEIKRLLDQLNKFVKEYNESMATAQADITTLEGSTFEVLLDKLVMCDMTAGFEIVCTKTGDIVRIK